MRKIRGTLVKLTVFVVVAVVITISVIATLLDLKLGQPSKGYHAIFSDVNGLQAGDTVRIAGVEVGKVNGVSLTKNNQADVTFSVLSSQHLTTHAQAVIEFENLLGQRYLGIQQGPPGGAPARNGWTIPATQTNPGLDLTTVFSGFQPLLNALDPQQINQLTGSIIAVLQGESGAVANLVSQTASLTNNLAQRQQIIDQVLDNLTPLLTKVNTRDAQLGQLIDSFQQVAQGLAGDRGNLGSAITGVSQLTSTVSNTLTRAQPALDHDVSSLQSATAALIANQQQINAALADLPPFLNSIDKVTSSGSYIAVYICDLTLTISGPLSVKLSPTVPQSPPLTIPDGAIGPVGKQTQVCK